MLQSCSTSILGISLTSRAVDPDRLVADLVRSDPEADVVANVEVTSNYVLLGVYNRRCVTVGGDLARRIRTIAVPFEHH
jgi:hypothetical protein